jgi:tRNA-Thr(GGU) m(6)t(6)A37 methyltransferase TsaA
MAAAHDIALVAIGHVRSPLTDAASAPKQGHEGSPPSSIVFDAAFAEGLEGFAVGGEMIVLTWLDRAARDVLRVRPRDDERNPQTGVFRTRSPARPNPIGLHRVWIESIDGLRFGVRDLEALDGTPVVDVKPPLDDWER